MLSIPRSIAFCKSIAVRKLGLQSIQSDAFSSIVWKHGNTVVNSIERRAYNKIGYRSIQLDSKKQFNETKSLLSEGIARKEKPTISVLGKLRKQTGYSLSLCKKALANCDQDVEKAKCWLEEQAQDQGWSKANKLEGRNTSQGLIGVCLSSDERTATMVELNSETDFVARNKQFHNLLNTIITVILGKTSTDIDAHSEDLKNGLSTQHLKKDALNIIPTNEKDKSLADLVALNIGQIGENIVLQRASIFSTHILDTSGKREDTKLAVVTHPSANPCSDSNNVAYGRFGVIIAYSKKKDIGILPEGQTVSSLARQLCQHIIGMNPSSVGSIDDKSTWPKSSQDNVPTENNNNSDKGEGVKDDENWEHVGEAKNGDISPNELIHQPFLLNSEIIVRDLLLQTGIEVKTFVRFELGEQKP